MLILSVGCEEPPFSFLSIIIRIILPPSPPYYPRIVGIILMEHLKEYGTMLIKFTRYEHGVGWDSPEHT